MNYPKRQKSPIFALKFLRDMYLEKIPTRVGPTVAALLTAVVVREDAGFYRGPVLFRDDELADAVGCSIRTLQTARRDAVEWGFLSYTQGRRDRPSAYFVVEIDPDKLRGNLFEPGKICRVTDSDADHYQANFAEQPEITRQNLPGNSKRTLLTELPIKDTPKKPAMPPGLETETMGSSSEGDKNVGSGGPVRKPRGRFVRGGGSWPLFDAIAVMSGSAAHGRIAKLAAKIEEAGIGAEEFTDRLPTVVARFAAWRKTLDLDTITACWQWIRTPPAATPPAPKPTVTTALTAAAHAAAATKGKPLG